MSVESFTDVLIIGAGPAGLMCANALTAAGVKTRIIDKRPTKVAVGQADGIQPRTIEVMQSYGLGERLLREARQMHMSALYKADRKGEIKLVSRTPSITLPSSRYPFLVTHHQGATETIFIDSINERGVQVERPKQPSRIEISEDPNVLSSPSSYPVKVTIENLDESTTKTKKEIVNAKYAVGADGAHSWVRKSLGIEMQGEQTDSKWGVIDLIAETDFPDVRNVTVLDSAKGTCLVLPRTGDLFRLYVQLSDEDVIDPATERADKNRFTPEKILSVAREMFRPFKLGEPKYIDWWTIYIVGQHIASKFSVKERVFIAGDACHTHSPKAGQGMNASMNDTHNLAWKLVHVLRGWSSPSLLKTYEDERRMTAQELIDFDRLISGLFSGKIKTPPSEHPKIVRKYHEFATGLGIQYSSSAIVDPKHQRSAKKLIIGRRMLPQIFVRAADAYPSNIQDLLPADFRFKLLFFVGNLTKKRLAEMNSLGDELSKPTSFLRKYSPGDNSSTVFDIVTIAVGKKEVINHLMVPLFFRTHWTKVLLDDTDVTGKFGGHGYKGLGIDRSRITIVVVRPDGYVGTVVPSTALADLDAYFGSFMIASDRLRSKL